MKFVGISGIGTASPPLQMTQEQAKSLMLEHFGSQLSPRNRAIMNRVFSHPSIQRRSFAMDRPDEPIEEDQDEKIARFTRWAVDLGCQALQNALSKSGKALKNIKALIVNTCTGYICPGLSTYLSERLHLDPSVRLYDLVGAGCGGAIPNLQLADALVRQMIPDDDGIDSCVLSVSIEICTATFQMGDDLSLIISNALFGDGAAAICVERIDHGLHVVNFASFLDAAHRDDIRYIYKSGQLYNQLSTDLPEIAGRAVERVVRTLLEPCGLDPTDVHHWAMHSGGEKVIESVRRFLGLPESTMEATRKVLRDHGNMSSPTTIFALDHLMERGMKTGDYCVVVGFGAGMSAHACLLRLD